MVKPDVRKQLGEFYTPDWLSEKMINEMLSKDPKKSVLDPSCGSLPINLEFMRLLLVYF